MSKQLVEVRVSTRHVPASDYGRFDHEAFDIPVVDVEVGGIRVWSADHPTPRKVRKARKFADGIRAALEES